EKNTFVIEGVHPLTTVCCAPTQTRSDLEVYIPKLWTDYYGYSQADLLRWLTFLSKCEIGFEYSFEGLKNLPSNLRGFNRDETTTALDDHYFVKNDATQTVIPLEKDYYCVRISSGESSYHTYMKFICLRYLYNDGYWSIPGTAMQIKR